MGPPIPFSPLSVIISTKMAVKILTNGKSIFNIQENKIEIGETANLTLFNPDKEYIFDKANILSKSKNSIFKKSKLRGVVYGTINKNKLSIHK